MRGVSATGIRVNSERGPTVRHLLKVSGQGDALSAIIEFAALGLATALPDRSFASGVLHMRGQDSYFFSSLVEEFAWGQLGCTLAYSDLLSQ
jgi:hypothetical protein